MNLSPDPRRLSRAPRALIALSRRVQLSAEVCDLADEIDSRDVIPAAARRNGKLDRIHIVAAAYTAGPYAEGEYDIVLPVGPQLIRLMKPQYRASFEAQRQ